MENPVVRSIVSHPSLAFPVAGTIVNYNPALGADGIIGVKSGFTSEALGCLATAAFRSVAGQSVLVVAVSLGQPGGLWGAGSADEGLLSGLGRAARSASTSRSRRSSSGRNGLGRRRCAARRCASPASRRSSSAGPVCKISASILPVEELRRRTSRIDGDRCSFPGSYGVLAAGSTPRLERCAGDRESWRFDDGERSDVRFDGDTSG